MTIFMVNFVAVLCTFIVKRYKTKLYGAKYFCIRYSETIYILLELAKLITSKNL